MTPFKLPLRVVPIGRFSTEYCVDGDGNPVDGTYDYAGIYSADERTVVGYIDKPTANFLVSHINRLAAAEKLAEAVNGFMAGKCLCDDRTCQCCEGIAKALAEWEASK